MNRHPRTPFSLLKPDLMSEVENKQRTQKHYHGSGRVRQRKFHIGQKVSVSNNRQGKEKWLPGVVVAVKGPATYLARVYGRTRYVHSDHVIQRSTCDTEIETVPTDEHSDQQKFSRQSPVATAPDVPPVHLETPIPVSPSVTTPAKPSPKPQTPRKQVTETTVSPATPPRRYPERQRQPVVRLNLYKLKRKEERNGGKN